ncbi:MAG TPA: hypothetical protein VIT88_14525 [Pyrinomonadaceae bacterium]
MFKRNRKRVLVFVTVICVAVLFCLVLVMAQRPRQVTIAANRTIYLRGGQDLQAALLTARFGDTIVLESGATFKGPIVLPYKAGTGDYITIRTSDLAGVSRDGERIKPAIHARAMPKIVAPPNQSAVTTKSGAHHYKFVGVEFLTTNTGYVHNVIDLGASDYRSLSEFPSHLIFDRCYVHSTGLNRARRGFALNSSETSIVNSHISGFAGAADETQAIAGWNGPGPFRVVNNYLEGAGEVVMFGGADPSIPGLVPSDIEIRRNHLRKPKEWLGRAAIKGTFELKNARRAVIEGNWIESEILTTAVVLTVRNQNGKAPWSTLEDIVFKNNVVRHADTGVNLLGIDNDHASQTAKRIRIANNLFINIVVNHRDNIPYFLQTNGGEQVTVEHNTVEHAGNVITAYGNPTRNFVFRGNIVQVNQYGIVCMTDGVACSRQNYFCNCFPRAVIQGNIFVDNLGVANNERLDENYPQGNYFVTSFQRVGFADYQHGDWRLGASSKTRDKTINGLPPGADVDAIRAAGAFSARTGSGF